jgi:hypothetical protein
MIVARFVMTLGEGCIYSGKIMVSRIPEARFRRDAFFLLSIARNVGLFGGPLLIGVIMLVNVRGATAPLVLGLALALGFLALVVCLPTEVKWPTPEHSSDFNGENATAETTALVLAGPREEDAAAAEKVPEGMPPFYVAVTVQATCLCCGISRSFFRYAYESAMVVVFTERFGYTEAGSGILVGVLGLCTVLPILAIYYAMVWQFQWDLEAHSYAVILSAALAGVLSGVLILLGANDEGQWYIMLSALPFYAFEIFATAMGNSHPLKFAIDDSRLFNREAIIARQEMLQAPVGTFAGLIVGRAVLGDSVDREALGQLFLYGMLLQLALFAVGWDPRIWLRNFEHLPQVTARA